jgi:hypothetical protein
MLRRLPFSVTVTFSARAAAMTALTPREPLGRPRGLPLTPGVNRVSSGGRPRPTL